MLKPTNEWKWYFDAELGKLMLHLGQEQSAFSVSISRRNLIADAYSSTPFSVDDASCLLTYQDAINETGLPGACQTELVLNAVAAKRFHKPFLPKSWFFHPHNAAVAPMEGSLIELVTSTDSAQFIVIENTGSASLCMLAQTADFQLNENKSMQFCDTIKVMNDRIFVLEEKAGLQSLALVG